MFVTNLEILTGQGVKQEQGQSEFENLFLAWTKKKKRVNRIVIWNTEKKSEQNCYLVKEE